MVWEGGISGLKGRVPSSEGGVKEALGAKIMC